MSHIYFIQNKENDEIKIGCSRDIFYRKKNIENEINTKTRILKIIPNGGYPKERELHKKFKKHRSHGEWFYCNDELMDYIESIEIIDFEKIENKIKTIAFLVPAPLKIAIVKRAENELMTVAEWIRQLIIKELKWSHNADKTKLVKNK